MGYGVIGSPADSGSVSLGSSPGTPAQYSSSQLNRFVLVIFLARPRRLAA
ncbi:MAG: hypothetical protein RL381_894 [Actinomycetota bacterium]